MAKLIDLMRQAGVQWPEGAEYAVQDVSGNVKFGAGDCALTDHGVWIRDRAVKYPELLTFEWAEDWRTYVTREQWLDTTPEPSHLDPEYMREQQRIAARRQERHDLVRELMLRHPELTGQQAIKQADEIIDTLEELK